MPDTAHVKFVNRNERSNPFERITHLGGYETRPWKVDIDRAISLIESGKWRFFVEPLIGDPVWVEVATSRYGRKYLKTKLDRELPTTLLSLPEGH